MRIEHLDTGFDFDTAMQEEVRRGERAVWRGMHAASMGLKKDWRAEVEASGLGRRVANSIRERTFPEFEPSLNTAALVWSRAPTILSAHETGPLIKSIDGFWLAIPTEAAGKGRGGKRTTPLDFERRTGLPLRFVYRRIGPSWLIAEGRMSPRGLAVKSKAKKTQTGLTSIVIFLLVPQVKLRKRLDLIETSERWWAAAPALILKNWEGG